jgi:hypothetical protein
MPGGGEPKPMLARVDGTVTRHVTDAPRMRRASPMPPSRVARPTASDA